MDSYPGDWLAGVFPLVFAVDAIPSSSQQDTVDGESEENALNKERSLFDRFLDAMAATLVDDEDSRVSSAGPRTFYEEDEDSSDEDSDAFSSRRNFIRRQSPLMVRSKHKKGASGARSPTTAYATYHSGEGFFQRARILPVSEKHGFPPSKDPDGSQNRSILLSQARATMALGATGANALRLSQMLEANPVDGILPSGWLEKHVHALPSALLVVTSLSKDDQDSKDVSQYDGLLETIEHLQESLAPKRECHIHVVCLIEDMSHVSQATIDMWFDNLRENSSVQSSNISLLSKDDLQTASTSSSPGLRRLHKTVRDASYHYYLQQARRTKKKLGILGHQHQPELLPLAIRYCFKIGVFYEFQLKHSKSLRYFAEAYRHVETYYHHVVLGETTSSRPTPVQSEILVNPQGDDTETTPPPPTEESSSVTESDGGGEQDETGIEVALIDEDDESSASSSSEQEAPASPDASKIISKVDQPDDMSHQCRAVADWLNLKLLQAGFLSSAYTESPEGLRAAAAQWRRHSQCFLARNDSHNPSWNYWSFVAHQRLVMSQLVERHEPRTSEGLSHGVLQLFSTWRNYQATAEALLCLARELRVEHSAESDESKVSEKQGDSLRKRYVGGFESEGLRPKRQEEEKRNHKEDSLQMALRAVSCFEQELEAEKVKGAGAAATEKMFLRSGARLYYITGGILLGSQRHKEAIPHLEKVVRCASGWSGLELATRRMLIECYEACPSERTSDQGETIASMIMDSYFNAEMAPRDLRRALDSFATLGGGKPLKWHRVCLDESDSSLPLSFSVTFPEVTHATAGDSVNTSVLIKSNLDYAIHVKSVTLLSMAGPITIPSNDLLSAKNANEGSDGGIIIQANKMITLSTQVNIPRDINLIEIDESGNGGEKAGTPGKGSFARSARPRSAGLTAAAGARLLSEQDFGSPTSQWSVNFLGGKSLRCDGLQLLFAPVHVEKGHSSGAETVANVIDLTIEKKKPTTAANIKRTPFEEDNYICSAWSRPSYLPLLSGPRCIRVLGPSAQMVVTNLTSQAVHGKALEGTVNRVLLQLKAGMNETCLDVKYKVKCSSTVLSSEGIAQDIFGEEDPSTPGDGENEKETDVSTMRPPVLVSRAIRPGHVHSTEYGYNLPSGWDVLGTGRENTGDISVTSTLKPGAETFVVIDLYRPPRASYSAGGTLDDTSNFGDEQDGICQTDFEVSITYRQARQVPPGQGKRRRKAREDNASKEESQEEAPDLSDVVSLEHTGSVVWTSPVSADFSLARTERAHPSGSQHPSNLCPYEKVPGSPEPSSDETSKLEIALVDKERISSRCTLRLKDSLGIEIKELKIENPVNEPNMEKGCTFRPVCENWGSGFIFKPADNDISRQLKKGSKFGITYTLEVNMPEEQNGGLKSPLGVFCVHWTPLQTPLPQNFPSGGEITAHGPLTLEEPSVIKFLGPPCTVERAPFESVLHSIPSLPQVGNPFELSYRISNKTSLHQKLRVMMKDSPANQKESPPASEGILVSGLANGEIRLAPFESKTVSYTALAMRAGTITMPAISISSDRYKSWIVNGTSLESRQLYVLP